MDDMEKKLEEAIAKVENMSKLDIAKAVAKMAAHHCVSVVVTRIVKDICPTTSKKQQLELYVGAYILSHVVAEKTDEWAHAKIDATAEFIQKIVNMVKTGDTTWTEATQTVAQEEEPTPTAE